MSEDRVDELLQKLQKYFSHITAAEIMNQNVITLTPERTLWQAKELMKIRKISGIPVVNDKKQLIGIVSIEDIIVALEKGCIKDSIEEHMTKKVVSFSPAESLDSIISKFERYHFGRFPVIDESGKILGVISKKDIIRTILERFRLIYVHDERRSQILEKEAEWFDRSLITGDYVKKSDADFTFRIDYTDVDLAGAGAAKLKAFLNKKELDERLVRRVAIATYEAEVNVVIHSESEGCIYCWVEKDCIKVRVEDHGKGIENVEQAMKEGYSTATDHIRELGFGAGMGLPNMRRYSDKMVVMSEVGKGVVVEMIFCERGRT
ncbi:CBS domain-containing protein [Kosmotoga pacifica]|uniref:Serine/threonine protein kinase n=1 Tax=Kosmotoga pacifica TaxID=1330330 RepID=A0A0G2Z8U7_9BACT|nr:CBS domain-containing protein [Kosmotoga pacifica]AKI96496.1 serine/threonine protein kinase [Kosmotoga pacifica]